MLWGEMLSNVLKIWLMSMANTLIYCKKKVLAFGDSYGFNMPPKTRSSREQTQNVVVEGKEHQAHQNNQAYLMSDLPFARTERPTLHDFDDEEK